MPELLEHGQLAWVVRTEFGRKSEPELARFADYGDDVQYWTYFGSDWLDRVDSTVVEVVKLVEVPGPDA